MDPVGQPPEFSYGLAQVGVHGIDEPGGIGRVGLDQAPGGLKAHRDGNELLLRAVVQVAFDLATGVIGGLGDARAGSFDFPQPHPR